MYLVVSQTNYDKFITKHLECALCSLRLFDISVFSALSGSKYC